MGAISRIAVMEGTLDEVSLVELLQVLSIGRQFTVIELRLTDESSAGTLFVKSGKLIAAASAEARGKEAFFRLVPSSLAVSFHVFRTDTPRSMPEPVGALRALLLEALERGAPALPAQASASTTGNAQVASKPPVPRAVSQPLQTPAANAGPGQARRAVPQRVESQPLPRSSSPAAAPQQQRAVVATTIIDASTRRPSGSATVAAAPIKDTSSQRPAASATPRDASQRPSGTATTAPKDATSQRPVGSATATSAPTPAATSQRASTSSASASEPATAQVKDAASQRVAGAATVASQPTKEAPRPPPDRTVAPVRIAPAPQARTPQSPAPQAPLPTPDRRRERPPQRQVSGEVPSAAKPPFVVAIASPKGGCGKTTLALNLAVTLARQNRRVILVDADINGDIASAIDARSRARYGAFDVLTGQAKLEEALLTTVIPDFKILPASGPGPVDPSLALGDSSEAWRTLLRELAAQTDIVLVDAPAGMLGAAQSVLRAVDHVLGVLQAELIAYRSFNMFAHGLQTLPASERPRVLGVVLNMVQPAALASVTVLQQACVHLPAQWLLETSIPRSNVFLDASEMGLPLRLLDDDRPPALSFLFETLASELIARLEVVQPVRRPQRLLA